MTAPQVSHRLEFVSRLAAEGNTYRLARELMDAAVQGELDDRQQLSGVLLSLSEFNAAKLRNDMIWLYQATVSQQWVRYGWSELDCRNNEQSLWGRMVQLRELLISSLPSCRSLDGQLKKIDDMGQSFILPHEYKPGELAAGVMPSVSFLTALRRTERTDGWKPEGIGGLSSDQVNFLVLNPGEAWSDRVLAELPRLHKSWPLLLQHALTATSARPTAEWRRKAQALIDEIGPETVLTAVVSWIGLVEQPRSVPLIYNKNAHPGMLDPYNAVAVRGLVWLLAQVPEKVDSARVLGRLVEFCLRKIPGAGPRDIKVANAAVYTLSALEGEASLGELARLSARLTFKATLKLINGALESRAQAMGRTREEIEELSLPSYGLTSVGHAELTLGDTTALISVSDGKATLTWRNKNGRTAKAVPATVRRDHPDEVKALRASVKDIDKMLAAQSTRLERLFLSRRSWTLAAWRDRYADHPLLGTLTQRLLWNIDGQPCGYVDDQWCSLDGKPIEAAPDVPVELWHPTIQDAGDVVAARNWLQRHGITQPFKQAHREVYRLTDAERQTHAYSNRFAAHILRQHQFNALAAKRGWRNQLRMGVDDVYPPATIELPAWGLRGEYWVEGIGGDVGQSGSFLTIRTDQIRFYPLGAPQNYAHASGGAYEMPERVEPLPLEEIPDLVLSEVLRDVDLFVGVASIGNDPTWQDGGPGGRFQHYWNAYAFGDLSHTAQTRKEVLTGLLPRLSIADQCGIDGRFLNVRGTLRTYRIHLGSGSILVSPNDSYLCIVPLPGNAPALHGTYLPFEGDRTLATILSKAMLLAHDHAIVDPAILHQLK